jgi:DNA primase small subunit
MNDFKISNKSIDFLKKNYKDYYKNNIIDLPDRFGRREYAFLFFNGKGMIRHLSFNKKKKFNKFLIDRIPAHCYYSSAYYYIPDASSMQEKKWMGAELIFDLDSDHLPQSNKLNYDQQLNLVKKEFYKLVNDFLLNDFGFNEKYIKLYFSGGRGYHCHVTDPRIFHLDSSERREIVDYITGRDLKEKLLFSEKITNIIKLKSGKNVPIEKTLIMPKPDEPGWRGRISRGLIDILDEIKKSKDPIKKLQEYGLRKNNAENLLLDLSNERINRIKEGRLDQSKAIRKFFLNNVLRKTAVAMSAGETDEPVTCDIKRLIRLPLSLHGKTGLKVTPLTIDEITDFNPLKNAVTLSEKTVKIQLNRNFKIKIKGEKFNLSPGENEIPSYLAVLLIGRKIANII